MPVAPDGKRAKLLRRKQFTLNDRLASVDTYGFRPTVGRSSLEIQRTS